jgi:hypothetical protein
MSFAHPWLAVGGIALALLPLLIHRWTRPEPRRLKFSAMRFLAEVQTELGRRSKLRDRLVLAARMAAIALIALALARARSSGFAALTGEAVDRVVVLDVSQSMAARPGGVAGFERARALALTHLAPAPGLRAGLVLAGARPRAVFDEPSANVGALREELRTAQPAPEALDADAALAAAVGLFARSEPHRARQIVVVTDLQRSGWETADLARVPAEVTFAFEVAASRRPAKNVAVTAVRLAGAAEPGGGVPVEVEVFNGSDFARTDEVELALADRADRMTVNVPPWEKKAVRFEVPAATGTMLAGTARIRGAADALPEDDARAFALPLAREPAVAVVTAQSARRGRTTAADYLARALAAGRGASAKPVARLASAELGTDALSAQDVVWLVHAGALPDDAVRALAGFLARGRGAVLVAAEPPDAGLPARLAKDLGDAATLPVTLLSLPIGQEAPDLAIGRVDAARRPFSAFPAAVRAHLAVAPVHRPVSMRRLAPASPDVLADFTDGTPALAIAGAGEGRLALLAADLAASPLARSPLFVPLVTELTAAVSADEQRAGELACGRPATTPLPAVGPAQSPPLLLGPDGKPVAGAAIEERNAGAVLRWVPAVPGLYMVRAGDASVTALAAACPAGESDLRAFDAEKIRARTTRGSVFVQGDVADADGAGGVPVWPYLALAAALACLLEAGLLAWWRA